MKNLSPHDRIVKIWAEINFQSQIGNEHEHRRKGGVMKAYLILEDGTVFEGTSIGSTREVISEIVFNTSMTGYLEVLTDPSYAGQAVVMTYPLIGNYGICKEDMESGQAWPDGYIVRELSRIPSNFGMITTNGSFDQEEVKERIRAYQVTGVVLKTTTKEKYVLPGEGKKVALMDFGAKKNIARELNKRGCEVTVYPADTPAEEVLKTKPDGIMLSNGPGDPAENTEIIKEVRKFYESDVPVFAICLGHQLMALATGANTYKLKYGHRGGNRPVKDLETGRVYISSQNHGYAVDEHSMNPEVAVPAFVNVNDKTNEGLKYVGKNIFTVQYHPEACPGPQDSGYLFDRFLRMMEEER